MFSQEPYMVMYRTDIIRLWSGISVFYVKCMVDSCPAKRHFDFWPPALFRWLSFDFHLDRGWRSEYRMYWSATPLMHIARARQSRFHTLQFIIRAFPKCMLAGGYFSLFIISFGPSCSCSYWDNNLMSQPNTQNTLIIFHYRYHGPYKENGSCNLLYSIS